MARYNTTLTTNTTAVTAGSILLTPGVGQFTKITSGGSGSIVLPDPSQFSGTTQSLYNASGAAVTINTPVGTFVGPGSSGTANQTVPNNSTMTLGSDGSAYIIVNVEGGPMVASTLTATGNVTFNQAALVTISPTGGLTIAPSTVAGTIDNVAIGGTTRAAGAFTTLAANNAVTMTLGTDASAYNTGGTLTITGGMGISGQIFSNSNITAAGTLTLSSTSANHAISSTAQATTTTGAQAFKVAGGIGCNGTIYTVGLVETSSIAFKENIKPIAGALDIILKLTGVTYDRKDNKQHEAGLIAEHVFKHAPELVALDDKGKPYGIHYTKVSAYLIESIKALQEEVDELRGKKSKTVKKAPAKKVIAAKAIVKKTTKGSK
jgi:hypothetical protein